MKRLIRTIASGFMILVLLAGTTGVSFYIHECRSSGERDVVLFPELTNQNTSCCCATDVQLPALNGREDHLTDEPECCKNIHLYLKATISGFPVFFQYNDDLNSTDLPTDSFIAFIDDHDDKALNSGPQVDHPPPSSGKALIHFIHQLKIPAPVS